MTSHPNRSNRRPRNNPSAETIREVRQAVGLTQTQAAAVIHTKLRSWQEWEGGNRCMHPAFWELFLLKTGQLDLEEATPPES